MALPKIDDVEAFVLMQNAPTLASVLIELAREHDAVRARLTRMALADRPDRLAATFRKTLTGWRKSSRFLPRSEAFEFGKSLGAWVSQVEHELLPKDPSAALTLAEAFVEADATFFERSDDSDGDIGSAVRAGCRLWLLAAARCEAPRSQWPSRLIALVAADEYGAREELLCRANMLLDEAELRAMVTLYEQQMDNVLAVYTGTDRRPPGQYKISAALSLLAQALRDPDVHVRAVLRYSPEPNPVQKDDIVRSYLQYERPSDALIWLQEPWGHLEDTRQRLHGEVLARLGRSVESATIRQALFERTMAVGDLHSWLEQLPASSQAAAMERARQLAHDNADPVTAARVLMDTGDDAGAEAALVTKAGLIHGEDYVWLVPLAKELEVHQRWVGATAVYRALLNAILAKAYAPAYRHAARYWSSLQTIGGKTVSLSPLQSHADFVDGARKKHARKVSFWAHVNAVSQPAAEEDQAGSQRTGV